MAGGPGGVGSASSFPAWDSWSPMRAARQLASASAPWWVAGGWALEAHRGRMKEPSREHSDLDLALLRPDLPAMRQHLSGWDLQIAHHGVLTRLGAELPPDRHALWCRPGPDQGWAFELLISGVERFGDDEQWLFRRDEGVRLPVSEIGRVTPDGVPYLIPEIVLLFKAARAREVDEDDLRETLPTLHEHARSWLIASIERVHPDHAWLAELRA